MRTTGTPAVERQRALERAMIRVRWFGVLLGLYQTLLYVPNPGSDDISTGATALSLGALGLLLAVNFTLAGLLRRPLSEPVLRRMGVGVFGLDIAAVWLIIWAFSFEPWSTTWVILTILTLEGALRFELRGAMVPVIAAVPVESARELVRLATLPQLEEVRTAGYLISSVTFRVGVIFMVGAVAGAIARNLKRERISADERAREMEILAANESAARRESNAFQQVILAGVSAPDLREVLRAMTEVIYRELDYERLAVLLLEGDRFTVAAAHGFAPEVQEESPRIGQGIVGRVARTGEPEILEDVRQDPDYYCADERTRSQVTVPITLGDEVIGVIDVERSELAAFDEADRDRLQRLATQMALVIGNARLLATERATVERLQELDQMKSDFIAIASHELRTPLTSIQGSIKTLRRLNDIDPATAQELMAILDRQSDRLTRLVEDLLLASRIDSGRIQLQMTSTHFTSVVDKALAQLGSAALRVSVAIAPTIPRMITDEQRLAQILRNLIENALNVSDPGTAVRLTVHHTSAGLHVEVADEGLGIAEDDRAHIFDRFHQVGGSLRRRSDGLGLGLFITRRLVEALGGTITVESELGVGTTFRVTIPLTPAVDGVSDIA